jgi:SPP1 gp7 family putative phage head morphogenesis protein
VRLVQAVRDKVVLAPLAEEIRLGHHQGVEAHVSILLNQMRDTLTAKLTEELRLNVIAAGKAAAKSGVRRLERFAEFDESAHPRDEGGQFTDGGGSSDSSPRGEFSAHSAAGAAASLKSHGDAALVEFYDARATPLTLGSAAEPDAKWTADRAVVEEALTTALGVDSREAFIQRFGEAVKAGKIEDVRIDDLRTYQTWVGLPRLAAHISKSDNGPAGIIFHHGGKDWILDGNHRLSVLKLGGATHASVIRITPDPAIKHASMRTADTYMMSCVDPFADPESAETLADFYNRTATILAGIPRAMSLRLSKQAVSLKFKATNPKALAWATKHAGDLVKDVTSETRRAIQRIVTRSFDEQFTVDTTARLLRATIGLTERDADALLNLRLELEDADGRTVRGTAVPEGGISESEISRLVEGYSDELLGSRAETIARTETMRASNEGQLELWEQGIEDGFFSADDSKRWIITDDDRLCPICEALDGQEVQLDEQFDLEGGEQVDAPPAHPNCRCTIGLVLAKEAAA